MHRSSLSGETLSNLLLSLCGTNEIFVFYCNEGTTPELLQAALMQKRLKISNNNNLFSPILN